MNDDFHLRNIVFLLHAVLSQTLLCQKLVPGQMSTWNNASPLIKSKLYYNQNNQNNWSSRSLLSETYPFQDQHPPQCVVHTLYWIIRWVLVHPCNLFGKSNKSHKTPKNHFAFSNECRGKPLMHFLNWQSCLSKRTMFLSSFFSFFFFKFYLVHANLSWTFLNCRSCLLKETIFSSVSAPWNRIWFFYIFFV